MHESVYITCECCDELYVSTHAETKRLPVTDAQRRDGGIDFLGLPICDDCVGHDLHSCQDEKDVEDDTNVAERWGDPS